MQTVNNLRARVKSKFEMTLLSGERKEEGPLSQVQVEPKTYFANERTFIQWISAALLLLTVSSIMMGSGEYNGTSSVIAFAALVLVCYAAFVYFRRVQLLRTGQAYGYLDFLGPSILAVGVGLGVAIVFADAVKGSEFLPWGDGGGGKDKDDRRFLTAASPPHWQDPEMLPAVEAVKTKLSEVEGKCARYAMEGINLLEYQPRDIILHDKTRALVVATPQTLVTHPLADQATRSAVLAELPGLDIQSLTMVGDVLFALSIGPTKTELIEFNAASMVWTTILVQDASSTAGSLVYVPDQGKLYIHLDGNMHTYHLHKESLLSRTGSINMKVLNQGGSYDPISAMEHFEGLTYILRRNIIQVWDLEMATLVSEMSLPTVAKHDKWVGMALERRNDDEEETSSFHALRKSKMAARDGKMNTAVYLHMPLDTFPPQLWSFHLEDVHDDEVNHDDRSIFSFPECDGVAMN
jgi:uncharacterized membrane protein YidH (DUF202 family)